MGRMFGATRGWLVLSLGIAGLACGSDDAVAADTDAGTVTSGSTTSDSTSSTTDPATSDPTVDPGSSEESGLTPMPPDLPPPNEPPIAIFDLLPASGMAPLLVGFDAGESSDPDGEIVGFEWDFGDRATDSGDRVEHTFETAGCYTVELTVTDDDGATANATDTVAVVADAIEGEPDVVLDTMPIAGAVLPRDLESNLGLAHFSGTVNSVGYALVVGEVLEGETVVSTTTTPLCGAPPFTFELDVPINAELTAFDVRVSLATGDTADEIATVADLVAGDIFLVQGQSNAVSMAFSGDANADNQGPFIRSFGANTEGTVGASEWQIAQGNAGGGPAAIGQWPIRMAAVLSQTYDVPIGLLNGARGGTPISYFQRDDADRTNIGTNYGRLLTRTQLAGIDPSVRAILWYQGETDGLDFTAHHDGFVELYEDWLEDYPSVERTYVTQIRAGCGGSFVELQEVQRVFADDYDAISVMSTTGLDGHDGCHYSYANGYEVLGDRYAAMLGRDLYEAPRSEVDPPNPASASLENGGLEIVIVMRDAASSLTFEPGAEQDFRVEGAAGVTVASGSASGNEITLTLSGDATGATGISYLGRIGDAEWVTNEAGIGMLTFFALPLR